MSEQNYKSTFFPRCVEVKVNNEVLAALDAQGFSVFIDERSQYAAYGRLLPRCAVHKVECEVCGCAKVPSKCGFLHEFTWQYFHPDQPVGPDEVVHHRRNRFDNRIKNLEKKTRQKHTALHNAHRQRHGHRERFDGVTIRHRPPPPGKVTSRPDLKNSYTPPVPTPRVLAFEKRVALFEKTIEPLFGQLHPALAHLDSGQAIPRGAPRSQWSSTESRRVGVRMPRIGCTPAEGAVVLLAIKHEKGSNLLEEIATELHAPMAFIKDIWRRVPVQVALERWRKYRRLPTVSRKQVRD